MTLEQQYCIESNKFTKGELLQDIKDYNIWLEKKLNKNSIDVLELIYINSLGNKTTEIIPFHRIDSINFKSIFND